MTLTEEKIKVTDQMMEAAGMTRGHQFGIPDGNGGLIWKGLLELRDEDFDALEEYFINKKAK